MNNRYLYRAKRTDNREWIVGSLIQAPYLGMIRSWISSEQEDKARLREISSNQAVWRAFEVRTDTVCQCTSLKDKNGKLIWENDIVKHDFGECQIGVQLAIVKYDSKYACYQIKPIYDWMYCDKSDCEVIGNIFDNPELINE